MEAFDIVKAIYNPKITEDLRDYAKPHIGKEYEFEAMWIIEEDDINYGVNKRYVGQFAMKCKEIRSWVPEEDVEIVK